MIRTLRRRHRIVWILLAIALPALLVAAVLSRRSVPRQELAPTLAPQALPSDDGAETSR